MDKKKVAIFLFDDVEVLDFAGPFEVFSVTNELSGYSLMDVYSVAREKSAIKARNGLSVNPDYTLKEAPAPDILILPGGAGTRAVLKQNDVLNWIKESAKKCEKIMSICTGALLLAKAGLLSGLKATTHHEVFNELAMLAPDTEIVMDERFVDNGNILTSGGISAGIDMSLYVIGLIYGQSSENKTAKYMEYRRI